MCSLVSCDPGWGNCDGVIGTGCERSLTTLTDCAGCGIPCSFTGATASCGTGTCAFGSCLSGRSSCDGTTTNGCEVNHATVSGSCPGATDLGTYDGDRSCGFICGSNTAWDNFANATGRTSAWYQARVREDSSCSTSIEHRIRLTVPAGVDYDLYVYRPCGTLVTFSDAGTGIPEQVTISSTDDGGTDDSFTYFIEVRYFSGASCSQWTLSLDGHDC